MKSPFVTEAPVTLQPFAVSQGELVPVSTPVPALKTNGVQTALDYQRDFGALMETRGKNPTPVSFRNRVLDTGIVWGALGAAVVTALGLPAIPLFGVAAFEVVLATASMVGLFGFMAGVPLIGDALAPSPLSVLSRRRDLKPSDLAFLEAKKDLPPLETAVLGLLAERWMKTVDKQRVHGLEAYAVLDRVAKRGQEMPEEVRKHAQAIIAMRDAVLDPANDQPWRELSAKAATEIATAFKGLPEAERETMRPHLLATYFKGERARIHVATHAAERELYLALKE